MEDAPTVDQSLGDPIANFEGGQIPTNETKKVDKPKGAASSPNIDIWERSPEGERVSYKEKLAGNASFETCPTKSKNPDAYGEEGRQCGTYGNKPAGKETVWKTTDSSHADNTPTIIRPEVTEGYGSWMLAKREERRFVQDKALPKDKSGRNDENYKGESSGTKTGNYKRDSNGSRRGETVRYTVQKKIYHPMSLDWAMQKWGDWREHPNDPSHYGALEDDMEEEYFVEYG
nr:hypothetical protein Iba_chr13aCG4750 [Ipomoea batatas]